NLSENMPVEFLSAIKAGPVTIETAEANAVAAIVTSSGGDGVGLKASGTSKAIEAEGVIDMTENRIINVAMPVDDGDAATKKYVDEKVDGNGSQKTRCESFVFNGCQGGAGASLPTTNLGVCKKQCERMNAQCCQAVIKVSD